ncbi:hypothetical protein F5144DRAFT_639354 [Chaetomium tenue]|uniref:Uncharacterized protein n=1 Tax=Chaetomium tenue TaxID=1854479 RepID=A0ACB7PS54_9PEZI|nr:hypothetical protein F5144DRAFT_639354 [Chaetomium globosum]
MFQPPLHLWLRAIQAPKDRDVPDGRDKFILPPYYQMLARCRTRVYSLKFKKWLDFVVEQIPKVVWNSTAFDKLVLPPDRCAPWAARLGDNCHPVAVAKGSSARLL